MQNDAQQPHSPDVALRDTQDSGFSKDWGLHFRPSEAYWIDVHNHLSGVYTRKAADELLDAWYRQLDAYRLGQSIMLIEGAGHFDLWAALAREDPRFAWMYWPAIDAPSLADVERAARHGAVGLKMHNARIMAGDMPPDIYETAAWQRVFAFAEEASLPLLWHVTQRHSVSPYHGGGENAFWSQGWERGVRITNEDLLQGMLRLMARYPKLRVVGAHQLHVGPERLSALLDAHENLYIDSSCGFFLRWADDFIEEDRLRLKAFVQRYAHRILYGTDSGLAPGRVDPYLVQGSLCHARFFLRLGLEDAALQRVAWQNAKALFGLPSVSGARRGNFRP